MIFDYADKSSYLKLVNAVKWLSKSQGFIILPCTMRLTSEQVSIIRRTAQSVFGNSVQVFLFGSRTCDEKRGGDIDLLVQSAENKVLNLSNKISFIVELKRQLGDQKIDVVLSRLDESGSSIVQTARKTGIAVC